MFPNRDLILTCTYRDTAEQRRLYQNGRTVKGKIVTNIDGVKKKSKHNHKPAQAFDFAVLINGNETWDEKYYDSAWLFFREAKLTNKVSWGRTWKNFKDYPHIEEI